MGLGDSPSSINGSDTRSQTLSTVDKPLTDSQLMSCAVTVVSKLTRNRSSMVRMVEREELVCMSREAVVIADHRYRSTSKMTRSRWAISKGTYLVLDMMRDEARHTVCLSAGEFRGTVTDRDGNRVKNRLKVSMGAAEPDIPDEDRKEPNPISYLHSTKPPPEVLIHNLYLRERLEQALDHLPNERYATAFRLTVWHDWTQEAVGELLGVSGSRVSQMLTRARKQLRDEFSDLAPDQRVV